MMVVLLMVVEVEALVGSWRSVRAKSRQGAAGGRRAADVWSCQTRGGGGLGRVMLLHYAAPLSPEVPALYGRAAERYICCSF